MQGRFARFIDRTFDGITRAISRRLDRTLDYRPVTLLFARRRDRRRRLHVHAHAERSWRRRRTRASSSRWSRRRNTPISTISRTLRQQLYKVFDPCPRRSTSSPSTAWATSTSGFAGILLKPWDERKRTQKADPAGAPAKLGEHRRRTGLRLLAAAACRARPAACRCSSSSARPRRLPAALRRAWRRSRRRRARAACSSSPTAICASTRRRSSSRSTTTRPTGSASPWRISASRWPRCSAATTSTASISTAAVYQVIPQVPREYRLTPDWLQRYQSRTASGAARAAFDGRDGQDDGAARTRSPASNSSTRRPSRPCRLPGVTMGEAIDFLEQQAGELSPPASPRLPVRESGSTCRRATSSPHLRLRADRDLPGAGGAVRELPRPVHHPGRVPMSIFGALLPLILRARPRSTSIPRSGSSP